MIPAARPAVTTIVFRRDESAEPHDYRILFIRRPAAMKAFGGTYVYPGGTLQAEDAKACAMERCVGITPTQAWEYLVRGAGVDWDVGDTARSGIATDAQDPRPPALAFWVAAARELFEEVGILIACDPSGQPIRLPEPERVRLLDQRSALLEGSTTFSEILASSGWCIRAASFTYLFRIVTPTFVPRRYDTRFFLVEAPADQPLTPNRNEVEDMVWLSPTEALRRVATDILHPDAAKSFPMPSPTIFTLTTLDRHHRIDRLLDALRQGYTIR